MHVTFLRLGFAVLLLWLATFVQAGPILGEQFDQTLQIDPGSKVSIRNTGGSIMVYGTSTNELSVSALKRAYSAARLGEIMVNVAVSGGEVVIETKLPSQPKWSVHDRSGTVDYVIVVPWSCKALSIELGDGEMFLEGVRTGSTKASLGNGRLFITDCFADLNVEVARGAMDVIWTWWEPTKFSLNAVVAHGDTHLKFPRNAAFHLFGSAETGRVITDFPVKRSDPDDDSKIDTSIGGESQTAISVRNTSGNVEVSASTP